MSSIVVVKMLLTMEVSGTVVEIVISDGLTPGEIVVTMSPEILVPVCKVLVCNMIIDLEVSESPSKGKYNVSSDSGIGELVDL